MLVFLLIVVIGLQLLNIGLTLGLNIRQRVKEVVDGFPRIFRGPAVVLAFVSLACLGYAQETPLIQKMDLQPGILKFFANPDGSCVQCSIGIAGCHCNDPNAASLLWDTAYGPAERGGSNPSRVEAYCNRRGIRAWSVTGASVDDTIPWLEWAAKTRRFAAFGAGTQHFQTLYGYDQAKREWYVVNNNSTNRVDRYTDPQFRELHRQSGPWVVILERSSSAAPEFVPWFQK